MINEIRVPKLGMSQGLVTVVQWAKSDGESVNEGDPVVVIETAKVAYDVPSPAPGLVFSLAKINTKVRIGDILGVIADSRETFKQYSGGVRPAEKKEGSAGLFAEEDEEIPAGVRLTFGENAPAPATGSTPARAASLPQMDIDLTDRWIKSRVPFSGMRRTIADNLMYSLHSGAQLTITALTDLTELAGFREELKLDRPEAKITFVDLLVKLLPTALAEYPILNSAVVGEEIICWDEYHIGVAVALESGLVVPVVRNVDKKSLTAVSREIKKLARKARSGELVPTDYQGGTFTFSSGGDVEVEFITPIINPPENAILGIGKIGPKPAIVNNEIQIRTMTYLCLTHDHRVVDGVPASLFLGRLKELIETPELFRKILR